MALADVFLELQDRFSAIAIAIAIAIAFSESNADIQRKADYIGIALN